MCRLKVSSETCLLDSFVQSWVRMTHISYVATACAIRHAENERSDKLAGVGSDNVCSENDVVGANQDFYESVGLTVASGSTVGHEGKGAFVVLDVLSDQVVFSESHPGHFRMRVDH